MKLHRMPADETGRTAYYQPGGLMSVIAEEAEEHVLSVARQDIQRALALAEDRQVTKAELIQALFFLGQSCRAAVDVAECRGERLAS